MKKRYEINMTKGPLLPELLQFILPLMLSSMLQIAFNAADLIVADGDPLADLGALDHLLEIVIDGRTFTPDPIEPFVPERDAATATNGSHPNDVRATWHTNQQRRLAHEAGVAVPTA